MSRTPRLTAKEEAFALHIFAGRGVSEAHQLSYGGNGKATVRAAKASEVLARHHVQARIQKLRDAIAKPAILTRERKLQRLAAAVEEQIGNGKQLTNEQLKAIEIDSRMQGHNEPEKLLVKGMGSVLQKIRQTAPKP